MNYTSEEQYGVAFRDRDWYLENGKPSPEHRAMLNAAGITDDVIDDRGYFTVHSGIELQMLGLQGVKCPALVIPERTIAGDEVRLTIRPDEPADPKRKYLAETGKPMRITASPAVISMIRGVR